MEETNTEQLPAPKKSIARRALKVFLWAVTVCIFLWIIAVSLLRLPFFQTQLTDYYLGKIGGKIHAPMSVGKVEFSWVDEAVLHDVKILDSLQNPVIYVKQLHANFGFWNMVINGGLDFNEANLRGADVQLIAQSDGRFGLNQWVDGLNGLAGPPDPNDSTHIHLKIGKITVENSVFRMQNPQIDSVDFGFDNHNFTVKDIFGKVTDFRIDQDTIAMKIESMQGHEVTSDMPILDMRSDFMICRHALKLDKTSLYVGESRLKGDLNFYYNGWQDYSDFMQKISIDAEVKQSYLTSRDLAQVLPFMRGYLDSYHFKGHWKGPISNFDIRNLDLEFGSNSHLHGRISFSGLPQFFDTFIDANFKRSRINIEDLYPYIGNSPNRTLKELDDVKFNGRFTGFPLDFVANGKFDAPVGSIISDINFKIPEGGKPYYKGHLITKDFNLGRVIDNPKYIQNVTLEGDIEGTGLTVSTADFNLKAKAEHVGIYGYDYHNIDTKARFSREIFIGDMVVNDSSFQSTINGAINLGNKNPYLKINAEIPFADLHTMNIVKGVSASMKGNLNLDFQGLKMDDLLGTAQAKNFSISYDGDTLDFNHLKFTSTKDSDNFRALDLYSDFGQLRIDGTFKPSILWASIPKMSKEYMMAIKNDPQQLKRYYSQQPAVDYSDPSYINFDVRFFDFNPIMRLFYPNFYMTSGANIHGKMLIGYSYNLTMDTYLDSLNWQGNALSNTSLSVKTSKVINEPDPEAVITMTSDHQTFFKTLNTNNLVTELNWFDRKMDYLFQIKQNKTKNKVDLIGHLDFLDGQTIMSTKAPELHIFGDDWQLDPKNTITLNGKNIDFSHVVLQSSRQKLAIKGGISEQPNKEFQLIVEDFELNHLENFIDTEVDGIFNGSLTMKNFYTVPLIQNRLFIDNFSFNDLPLGRMKGQAIWDNDESKLDITFRGSRKRQQFLTLEGAYYPYRKKQTLDLALKIKDLPIAVAEPFLKDYASDFNGTTSGFVDVTGNLSKPVINGKMMIDTATVKVDYLQTRYRANGAILIQPDKFVFQGLSVRDTEGNFGNVTGEITHHGLRNFDFNINANFNNLMVLNTTAKDNSLYYGKAYASGNMRFFGPIDNFNISANMETRKNTKFNIPLESSSEEVGNQDYITFKARKNEFDFLKNVFQQEVKKVQVKGVNYDFKFKVTPDAFGQLIFDLQAGDIIQGRGNGNLELKINRQGDMSVFGDLSFTQGSYNFTLSNIINKEFIIKPESTISWNGDPYQAQLHIDAEYDQLTNLTAIVDTTYAESPEIRRRYPAKVLLKLNGPMMKPELSFDINLDKYPSTFTASNGSNISLDTYVNGFKNNIHVNEQEMKRQVFSLIVLGSLAPANSFNTSNTVGNSLSEFVSNQLSYWINQVDDNLSIALDLGQMDADAVNTFQLRLGYTFLDGRLRVSRDGGFTNEQSKVDFASIAGDWSVEYLLTPSGKYRVKMYTRNNYSNLDASLNQANTTTTGVSLLHTATFNSFEDLLRSFNPFKKRRKDNTKTLKIRLSPLAPKGLSADDQEQDNSAEPASDRPKTDF